MCAWRIKIVSSDPHPHPKIRLRVTELKYEVLLPVYLAIRAMGGAGASSQKQAIGKQAATQPHRAQGGPQTERKPKPPVGVP